MTKDSPVSFRLQYIFRGVPRPSDEACTYLNAHIELKLIVQFIDQTIPRILE